MSSPQTHPAVATTRRAHQAGPGGNVNSRPPLPPTSSLPLSSPCCAREPFRERRWEVANSRGCVLPAISRRDSCLSHGPHVRSRPAVAAPSGHTWETSKCRGLGGGGWLVWWASWPSSGSTATAAARRGLAGGCMRPGLALAGKVRRAGHRAQTLLATSRPFAGCSSSFDSATSLPPRWKGVLFARPTRRSRRGGLGRCPPPPGRLVQGVPRACADRVRRPRPWGAAVRGRRHSHSYY